MVAVFDAFCRNILGAPPVIMHIRCAYNRGVATGMQKHAF